MAAIKLWVSSFLFCLISHQLCFSQHCNSIQGSSELIYVTNLFYDLASQHTLSRKSHICTKHDNSHLDDNQEGEGSTFPTDTLPILAHIAQQLQHCGLNNIKFTQSNALIAEIPASPGYHDGPAIAFLSHVDTAGAHPSDTIPVYFHRSSGIFSDDRPLTPIKPQIHPDWNGNDIVFPYNPHLIMSINSTPRLEGALGQTLITTSGGSPLGADGIAGAVSMVALACRLIMAQSPKSYDTSFIHSLHHGGGGGPQCKKEGTSTHTGTTEHGPIRLIFVPGGELSSSSWLFGLYDIAASFLYILDAEVPGDIRYESPYTVTIQVEMSAYHLPEGLGAGTSLDFPVVYDLKLCHLPHITAYLIVEIASSPYSAEKSDGREPFIFVTEVVEGVEVEDETFKSRLTSTVTVSINAFDEEGLAAAETVVRGAAEKIGVKYEMCARVGIKNKKRTASNQWFKVLQHDAGPLRLARAAMRKAGLTPVSTPERGWSDSWVFNIRGMPTAILYSAWHAAHGPLEWTTAEEMVKVTDVMENLAGLWLVEDGMKEWCPEGEMYRSEPGREEMDGPAP